MEEVYTGTVVWFSVPLNYGFIKEDKTQQDIFCHFSDIVADGFKLLKAGQKVRFKIGKNRAGRDKAIEVEILK
jgi:CspA family cold shock protein